MARILFVGDEVQQRNYVPALKEAGHEVVEAASVAEAFGLVGPYGLLIVQVEMPWDVEWLGIEDMGDRRLLRETGVELANRLFRENECPILFICWGAEDRATTQQYRGGRYYPIMIPVLPSTLTRVVSELISKQE